MTNGTTTVDYQYNSDGIRTKKTVTTASNHTHVFQDTVIAPTCTENGYTLHSCVCGYIYQDSPVAAIGHTFTTTVVGTNCTEVGHTVYSCACGYYYEDGSNGHDFTTLVVEPSETVNGFTLHQCDCGYSYESDPVVSLASSSSSADVVFNTKIYDYIYNGSRLTQLTITTNTYTIGTTVETLYFGNGTVTYNGEVFYYVTNLQGDVIAILDDEGNAVVEYAYDAWGNILETEEGLAITGSMASTLGVANPLTYRGYVYDTESGLYYLQSRYYNANVGRFINADAFASTGQGLLGNNMFAYCENNPVCRIDFNGMFWSEIWNGIKEVIDTAVQCTIFNSNPVGSVIVLIMHYSRNSSNVVPQTEKEAIEADYVLLSENDDKFHQNNQKSGRNRKYVSTDGHYEAVYYSDGQLNDTPEDEGTYNAYSSEGGIVERYVGHGIFDVVPYMIWGNSLADSTTIIDRFAVVFE